MPNTTLYAARKAHLALVSQAGKSEAELEWLTVVGDYLDQQVNTEFVNAEEAYSSWRTKAAVTSRVLLEAPSKGVILWRNNLGAYQDEHGNFVRYGLANISDKMNKKIKSSDYIGLRRVLITPQHVGHTLGQAVAREIKKEGWRYNMHDPHEAAQAKFGEIFASYGGDFAFTTGVGSL
jgi:hypothetical protein